MYVEMTDPLFKNIVWRAVNGTLQFRDSHNPETWQQASLTMWPIAAERIEVWSALLFPNSTELRSLIERHAHQFGVTIQNADMASTEAYAEALRQVQAAKVRDAWPTTLAKIGRALGMAAPTPLEDPERYASRALDSVRAWIDALRKVARSATVSEHAMLSNEPATIADAVIRRIPDRAQVDEWRAKAEKYDQLRALLTEIVDE